MCNQRYMGGIMLVAAVGFVIITKDNPLLRSNMKSIQREHNQRVMDCIRDLGLIGAALLFMVDSYRGKRQP